LLHHLLLGANLRSLRLLSSLNTKAPNITQSWCLSIKVHGVTQTDIFMASVMTDLLCCKLYYAGQKKRSKGTEMKERTT